MSGAGLLVILIAYVPLAVFRGFVISTLWGWYVVPTFGAPTLSIVVAVGVSILVSVFTPTPNPDPDDSAVIVIVRALVYPAMALAFGAFWTLFR